MEEMVDNSQKPNSRGSSSCASACQTAVMPLPATGSTDNYSESSPLAEQHAPERRTPLHQQQLARIQPDQQSGRRASTKHGFVERFFRVAPTRNAAFITKLFSMVNEESTSHLIAWTGAGDQFTVFNNVDFSRIVLPKYFKHCNWSSFVRQLNMYDFHKINDTNADLNENQRQRWDFKHPWFNKSGFDRLHKIRRKPPRNRLVPQIQYSSAMQLVQDPQSNDDPLNYIGSSNHASTSVDYVNHYANTYDSNGTDSSNGDSSNSYTQRQQRQPSMDSISSAASNGRDSLMTSPTNTVSLNRGTDNSAMMQTSSGTIQQQNCGLAANPQLPPQQQQQQQQQQHQHQQQHQQQQQQTASQSDSSVQSSLNKLQTVAVSLESKLDTTAVEVNQLRKLVEDQQMILNELLLSVKYLKSKTIYNDDGLGLGEEGENRKPRKVHELLGSTVSATSVTSSSNSNYYSRGANNVYSGEGDVQQHSHPPRYQYDHAR